MIRAIEPEDLGKIKEIHEKYYASEFNLPDFNKHFINTFVITDIDRGIITVGGIRPILEVVAITDKDKNVKERISALNDLLTISSFIADHDGFDELHCFVQDQVWLKQLKKHGFLETKGKSLVFKI